MSALDIGVPYRLQSENVYKVFKDSVETYKAVQSKTPFASLPTSYRSYAAAPILNLEC